MRILTILIVLSIAIMAGKVTWSSNGKPTIDLRGKPVEGCVKAVLIKVIDTNCTK